MAPTDKRTHDGDPPQRSSKLAWITAAVCAVVVLVAVAVTAATSAPARSVQQTRPGTAVTSPAAPRPEVCPVPALAPAGELHRLAAPSAATPTAIGRISPARPPLLQLIDTITASDCDTRTGSYTYVQTRQWDVGGPQAARRVTVTQQARWRATNGAGRILTMRASTFGAPPGTSTSTGRAATSDRTYPAGGIAPVLAFPPRLDDVGILAEQLQIAQSEPDGATHLIRTIVKINQGEVPDLRYRTLLIVLLKDTDTLRHHGRVTDRAGRTGVAVSAVTSNGTTRDLLLLDEQTGEVLAYERVHRTGRGGFTVQTYLLFLTQTHTRAAT